MIAARARAICEKTFLFPFVHRFETSSSTLAYSYVDPLQIEWVEPRYQWAAEQIARASYFTLVSCSSISSTPREESPTIRFNLRAGRRMGTRANVMISLGEENAFPLSNPNVENLVIEGSWNSNSREDSGILGNFNRVMINGTLPFFYRFRGDDNGLGWNRTGERYIGTLAATRAESVNETGREKLIADRANAVCRATMLYPHAASYTTVTYAGLAGDRILTADPLTLSLVNRTYNFQTRNTESGDVLFSEIVCAMGPGFR